MTTVQELNKSQKSYREEQHEAFEAKVKASNVDSKYALFFYYRASIQLYMPIFI